MMRKTFKYRIYPTKAQARVLNEQFELCRWVFNETLALRKNSWEKEQKSVSLYDTNKVLTEWKKAKPELCGVHSQVLQKTQERVDLAFQAFFRRCKNGENPGYPRFKKPFRLKSLCYKQGGWGFNSETRILRLSKVGDINVNYHRPLSGDIKTVSVIRHLTGKFYVCFSVENYELAPLDKTGKIVGIDLGCKTLITGSDDLNVENPRFFKQDERELAKKVSLRDKSEGAEKLKYVKIVRRIHERIANRRNNLAWFIACLLTKDYDTVVFEKLDIANMFSFPNLNKSIRDVAWGNIVQTTVFKAGCAGKRVVMVDPAYTSKTCSRCGKIHEDFSLKDARMICSCGLNEGRDKNAALNILRRGLASLAKA